MTRFEELVNDYTLMGDTGAVIFSSYDRLLEFVEEIRADEREAIAQSLDKQADLAPDEIDRQWAQEMAAAVRARGEKI